MKRQGPHKFYDEEFKINSVKLWKESGKKQRENCCRMKNVSVIRDRS